MSEFPSDTVEAALAEVEADEKRLLKIAADMLEAYDRSLYEFDLLASAALNRSVALSSGFCIMIREKNLICAGALVRLQLDTALRLFAGFIADQPHEFAMEVFKGNRIDRMKDKSGTRMTDRHLVTQLANEYPWIEEVYERASNYVHLSGTHIKSALSMEDGDSGKIGIKVSSLDRTLPEATYLEAIGAFRECTKIVARYVYGWTFTKANPEEVAQMKDTLDSMEVVVNDWRGRNPQDAVDGMIHSTLGPCSTVPANWMNLDHWIPYASWQQAEADFGQLAFTCQQCFPGQGRALPRTPTV